MLHQAESLDRQELTDRYRRNRERSAFLFGLIADSAFYERPIPLRHPFSFYEGHLPAFSYLTLNERSLGEPPVDARLEKLFERGIDPSSPEAAQRHARSDWPTREEIAAFGQTCDEKVYAAFANAQLVDANNPRLVYGQAAFTVLEHEPMHHETLTYIIHRLKPSEKRRVPQEHRDSGIVRNDFITIPAGTVTLGADSSRVQFGWDNEFQEHRAGVDAFAIQRYPVTNAEFLEFVSDGGAPPPFWIERDGEFQLRGVFEEMPMPLSWPVYVRHTDARAYAQWKGAALPTEAEYHRAAFGTDRGEERDFPWGAQAPDERRGTFDFKRFDPEPVDAHPLGASFWGVRDLVGNGWEWTGTPFAPFPGFEPMASYPQYSADFFDGKHYVMKGASPVTPRELIRRSFRNWFYDDYPYMYAKFRLVLAA